MHSTCHKRHRSDFYDIKTSQNMAMPHVIFSIGAMLSRTIPKEIKQLKFETHLKTAAFLV